MKLWRVRITSTRHTVTVVGIEGIEPSCLLSMGELKFVIRKQQHLQLGNEPSDELLLLH
jgi:hypothetical protein